MKWKRRRISFTAQPWGKSGWTLWNKCREFIETETDRLAEAAFDRLLEKDQLCFYLECVECRFQIPSSIEIRTVGKLRHKDDSDVAKSLFEYAERAGFNQ